MCCILLLYTAVMGFLVRVPDPPGVPMQQSIRNMFFHVPMWFGMMILFVVSVVNAVFYLVQQGDAERSGKLFRWIQAQSNTDHLSVEYTRTGLILGILGLITGAIWANYQWGEPWNNDPKQIGAAVALLIYLAYFVLRGSITDDEKKARISAVYNIFAFFMLIPTLWVLPRLTESLHPGGQGAEGNPAVNPKDSSASIKLVFWPAVLGWTLLSVWITTLRIRYRHLQEKISHA